MQSEAEKIARGLSTTYISEDAFQQLRMIHQRLPSFLPSGPLKRMVVAADTLAIRTILEKQDG